MASSGSEKKANRLLKEKSPYLLQHAYNPVDWYPWGDEAFKKAKVDDKPIFLSVGYSTCHWCHVMERESFENEEIAQMLNESFVSIKIDREERPDIDRVYMNFVQATTGHGGWPLNVWLTPDLQPFIGGTYFPPENSHGRHGFKQILMLLSKQWKENRSRLCTTGSFVMTAIQNQLVTIMNNNAKLPNKDCIDGLLTKLTASFDENCGGFGGAPRFPQPSNLCFLMNYYSSSPQSNEGKEALAMTLAVLDAMSKGGIHDHVGQGFHRYSTDAAWHVPHFEKMLYDQSQLANVYLTAYQITQDDNYAQIAKDILLYVMRDLSDKSGGFYTAEDADSLPKADAEHKVEGAFCVWEEPEIRKLLSEAVKNGVETTLSDIFIKYYGVEVDGNVDPTKDPQGELLKKNVLIIRKNMKELAEHFKLDVDVIEEALCKSREILFEERLTRPKPHLDNKMVTSWNGLMIGAFSRASCILGDEVYLKRATKAALFVKKYLWDENSKKLIRSCYLDTDTGNVVQLENPVDGFSDDYSFLISGLLDLYEASFDEEWLEWASVLQERQNDLLWDDTTAGYFEGGEQSKLLLRLKQDQDGAEPSGNSIATINLLRLSAYVDNAAYRKKAEMIYSLFEPRLSNLPNALPMLLASFILYNKPQKQIILCGDKSNQDTQAMLKVIHSMFLPNKILILHNEKGNFLNSKLSILKTVKQVENKTTAFVCENNVCQLPLTSAEHLEKILKESTE